MWQTFADHRTLYNIEHFELDTERKRITITYEISVEAIDKKVPLYIKLPFRETIFKGTIFEQVNNVISVDIPTEIHMRDFRHTLRTSIDPSLKGAYLRPMASSPDTLIKVNLRDISQKGLGIYVQEKNIHLFRRGSLLELSGFDGIEFSTPLLVKVVWTSRPDPQALKRFGVRVGIEMLNIIPEAAIVKLMENPLPADGPHNFAVTPLKPEEISHLLKKDVHDVLKSMKMRPHIGEILMQLEAVIEQDNYIKNHIELLTRISAGIAHSMDMLSANAVEKLVYASYLHDAPFLSCPKLMRIKNLKEFERKRNELSPDEQTIFLNSPDIASDIALMDKEASLDVASILSYQKELPNREGFKKKNSDNIPPLAALFIVAHDLSDEVSENPEMSLESWLEKSRDVFVGGHFDRIMECIEASKEGLHTLITT